jgi:hypothetical protein
VQVWEFSCPSEEDAYARFLSSKLLCRLYKLCAVSVRPWARYFSLAERTLLLLDYAMQHHAKKLGVVVNAESSALELFPIAPLVEASCVAPSRGKSLSRRTFEL